MYICNLFTLRLQVQDKTQEDILRPKSFGLDATGDIGDTFPFLQNSDEMW